jgi:2-keto-4-pentenoate hydratase/2-oxohepta-3-ene-1,7-dioic acid hydratase in catechol pathway
MKLLTFRNGGGSAVGLLYGGRVLRLDNGWSDVLGFLGAGEAGRRAALDRIQQADAGRLPKQSFLSLEEIEFAPPVLRPGKIVCVGRNYRGHCEEQDEEVPKSPILFAKFPTALVGHRAPVPCPSQTQKLDYEAELAVVIGRCAKEVSRSEALSYVAGYANFNDVSARDIQFADGQWVRGKSFDGFAPMGPFLVTSDEVPDPQNLSVRLELNGTLMQDSNTSRMIFPVAEIVSFCSRSFTLEPGDIIATGTPDGVGVFRKPPLFLKPGDTMTVEIGPFGCLVNSVVAPVVMNGSCG